MSFHWRSLTSNKVQMSLDHILYGSQFSPPSTGQTICQNQRTHHHNKPLSGLLKLSGYMWSCPCAPN